MNFICKTLIVTTITFLCGFNCYANEPSNTSTSIAAPDKKDQFKKLWNELGKRNIKFPLWKSNWNDNELKTKFTKMQKDRLTMYFVNTEDYGKKNIVGDWKDPQETLKNIKIWKKRYPYPTTLLYTRITPDYNASTVTIDGINFVALEAPSSKNVETFFKILTDYKVTDLVRLSPKAPPEKKRGIPYWDGHVDINSLDGNQSIKISNREINYFATDLWANHFGIEPAKLLALIKKVKSSIVSEPKMIAVHCSAGTGRTGTFIVAYALINEIDKQLASGVDAAHLKISIDKLFWKLAFQRPYAIARFAQYLTLYKLVDYYLNQLSQQTSSLTPIQGGLTPNHI